MDENIFHNISLALKENYYFKQRLLEALQFVASTKGHYLDCDSEKGFLLHVDGFSYEVEFDSLEKLTDYLLQDDDELNK